MANRMGTLYEYDANLKNILRREKFTHNVYSMCEDNEGQLWLGMRGIGLRIGADQWYRYNSKDNNSLSNDNVYLIYRDRKGRMWIGTFGGGLNRLSKQATVINSSISFKAVMEKNGYASYRKTATV